MEVAAPSLPSGFAPAFVLASRTTDGAQNWSIEALSTGGQLLRGSAAIRPDPHGPPTGVVITSVYLTGELARHSRRIVDAYQDYEQLRVLKRPLEGVYLSFFLGLTLLILISATWMGLYLAKRITRPVQMLAAGAREIGAGHLEHRIEPETQRRVRRARRGVQPDGAASWRQAGGISNARASISSRRASKRTRGAATSRPSSNASPPGSCASIARAA